MFLIPLIQDIEICSDEKRINKNTKDYIYLEKEGQILKFKVSIPHLDITSCLEDYLENLPVNKFDIRKESFIKPSIWPLDLVRYIGKFKLEGEHFKTKNYLVPTSTGLSRLLCEKYRHFSINVPFYNDDLKMLNEVSKIFLEEERTFELEIINTLKSNLEVELQEIYDIDLNQLEQYIKNIEKMLGNDECRTTLSKLRDILISSGKNKSYIKELGIEYKFHEAIKKDKEKQKVK